MRLDSMLNRCANPACLTRFRKLEDGKLFVLEVDSAENPTSRRDAEGRASRRLQHYWLCGPCASVLTLSFEQESGVVAVPLAKSLRKMPASSTRTCAPVERGAIKDGEAELWPALGGTGAMK